MCGVWDVFRENEVFVIAWWSNVALSLEDRHLLQIQSHRFAAYHKRSERNGGGTRFHPNSYQTIRFSRDAPPCRYRRYYDLRCLAVQLTKAVRLGRSASRKAAECTCLVESRVMGRPWLANDLRQCLGHSCDTLPFIQESWS